MWLGGLESTGRGAEPASWAPFLARAVLPYLKQVPTHSAAGP